MFFYLLLLQISFCFSSQSLFEKKFFKVKGFQLIEIENYQQLEITKMEKLQFTLNYLKGDYPLLVICNKSIQDSQIIESQQLIENEHCISDLNQYDQKQSNQIIQIYGSQDHKYTSKAYNVMQKEENQTVMIGVFSKYSTTFVINIQKKSQNVCAKKCRNGGKCSLLKGVCDCLVGFFGDDCSIQGQNIIFQQELQPQQIYYLQLTKDITLNFQRNFDKTAMIKLFCYGEQPYLYRGDSNLSIEIQLNQEIIEQCIQFTQNQNNFLNNQNEAYYIFSIVSDYPIKFINSNNISQNDNVDQTIIILLYFHILLFLLLTLICCCKQMLKNYKRKDENQDKRTLNYIDKYMPQIEYSETNLFIQHAHLDTQECSICLQQFKNNQKIRITLCKHCYHSNCLLKWLLLVRNCPLCRSQLDEQTLSQQN